MKTVTIDQAKLNSVKTLYVGSHSPDGKMCLMEAEAYVHNRPWSDRDEDICPVLGTYGRTLNDQMPDTERVRLLQFLGGLMGTRSTWGVEQKRTFLFADYAVRRFAPVAMRALNREDLAVRLEAVPQIVDTASAIVGRDVAR